MAEPTQRDIQQLTEAINELTKAAIKSSRTGRSGIHSGADTRSDSSSIDKEVSKLGKSILKVIKSTDREVQDLLKSQSLSSYELLKQSKLSIKQLQALGENTDDVKFAFQKLATKSIAHIGILTEDENYRRKTSEEHAKFYDSLNAQLKDSGINLVNVNEELSEKMKDGVEGILDFTQQLVIASGEADEILQDVTLATSENVLRLRDKFGGLGLDVTDLNNAIGKDGTIKSAEQFNRALKELSENTKKITKKTTAATAAEIQASNFKTLVVNKTTQAIERFGGVTKLTWLAVGTALYKAGVEYIGLVQKLGMSAAAGNIEFLYKTSASLGVSFETMSQIFNEQRREFLLMGEGNFAKTLDTTTKSFRRYGLRADEAAKVLPSMTSTFQLMGQSVKNADKLNSYIEEQTKNFADLSNVTGMTVAEISKANEEFMASSEIQAQLLGMSKQERLNKGLQLQQGVKSLTLMGVGLREAQELIKQSVAMGRERLSLRFSKSARLMQIGAMTGQADIGMEAARILQKGMAATQEERNKLPELLAKLNKGAEGFMQQGIGQQELMSSIMEPVASELAKTTSLGMAEESNRGVTSSQARVEQLGSTLQFILEGSDILSNLSTLPIIKNTLFTIAGGLALLGGKNLLGNLIGKIGGSGVTTGTSTAASSGASALGGIGGTLGKFVGRVGIAGLAMGGLSAIGGMMGEDSIIGKIANSKIAQYASIGMLAGPWGALAGGLLGAGVMGYENFIKPKNINTAALEPKSETTTTTVNNTSTNPEKTVGDLYSKLDDINTQLVTLLGIDKEQLTVMGEHKEISKELLSESSTANIKSRRIDIGQSTKAQLTQYQILA